MRRYQQILTMVSLAAGIALGGGAQAAKFKVLHSFCSRSSCHDGSNPAGALVMDQAGNFFGATSGGGGRGDGTVFELVRQADGHLRFKFIFHFCSACQIGSRPNGSLVIDSQGNLYGTANNLVFKLSPPVGTKKWTESILYRFCSQQNCADGRSPAGGLSYAGQSSGTPYDGVSPLFGATGGGGVNNGGTAFELTNSNGNWAETVLYNFCSQGGSDCTDGNIPRGLVMGKDLNLYGVTYEGGGNAPALGGAGVAFELIPNQNNSWTETVLYRFCAERNCADGARPVDNLLIDEQGNLLGATYLGGRDCMQLHPDGCGVLFKLVPDGSKTQETVLYKFCKEADCKDGFAPHGGLISDSFSTLFGATRFGGGNDIDQEGLGGGVIFELKGGLLYRTRYSFCALANCADGAYPNPGLTLDSEQTIYGAAEQGGVNGSGSDGGTAFKLN
jgi:hypothetical protein